MDKVVDELHTLCHHNGQKQGRRNSSATVHPRPWSTAWCRSPGRANPADPCIHEGASEPLSGTFILTSIPCRRSTAFRGFLDIHPLRRSTRSAVDGERF